MEKLVFVGIVFAIGVILYSLWQTIETQRRTRKQARESGRAFPTRRRAVNPPISVEEVQAAFQQRVDNWHRAQTSRWSGLRQSADALSGEKYTFVPELRQRVDRHRRPVQANRVRQQFELIG